LDIIIEKLQSLEKVSFSNGEQFTTKEGDETFKSLFKQLGLEDIKGDSSQKLTLNDLTRALENLRDTISKEMDKNPILHASDTDNASGKEKTTDLLQSLFKALNIESKEGPHKSTEFTAEQVRDHIKNELFANGKGAEELKASLLTGKDGKKPKLADIFKELAQMLSADQGGKEDGKNILKSDEDFTGNLKKVVSKTTEQPQAFASDVKNEDTKINIEPLKTRPAPKTLPAYVTNQVGKSLARAISQGESSITIQLKPPEMGRLLMTIENMGNNSMKVSIMTENNAAREILASNVNEIKTVLSNSGVNLERFDVDMGDDFGRSMADARKQAGQNSNRRNQHQRNGEGDAGNGNTINGPATELTGSLAEEGSVHYVI
ncbi:MAG: flagellar hook-length control protein FliK, partial [Desulfobacteraceae bacterium]|nr:flagellar hook-length control protein FliK [Desulfobacteraceae bacterium]